MSIRKKILLLLIQLRRDPSINTDLKDCILTEDGEESSSSTRTPKTLEEVSIFRRTMMSKFKLNSEAYGKKFPNIKKLSMIVVSIRT